MAGSNPRLTKSEGLNMSTFKQGLATQQAISNTFPATTIQALSAQVAAFSDTIAAMQAEIQDLTDRVEALELAGDGDGNDD
jgi:uncharacterized coiled-coil protein SlyX